VHRDLKLGNLFLSENMEIKIGDFGLATKLDFHGQKKRTICGTPNYIAPEVLEGKKGHSKEVDIWSLGVIIYTLLIGKPPFESENIKETYTRIKNLVYDFPDHIPICSLAKDLISRILVADPNERLDIYEVENHPFLNGPGIIPKTLCPSLLAVPPTEAYIKSHETMNPSLII